MHSATTGRPSLPPLSPTSPRFDEALAVSDDDRGSSHILNPVVHAAMTDLTSWVFPPLWQRIRRFVYGQGKWERRNLANPSNRRRPYMPASTSSITGMLSSWISYGIGPWFMGGRPQRPTNFVTMPRESWLRPGITPRDAVPC